MLELETDLVIIFTAPPHPRPPHTIHDKETEPTDVV